MIEWKDEALKAAWEAMFEQPYDGTQAPMIGAALDAAVEKQFDRVFDLAMTFAYESGYRDGIEDAAEKERDELRAKLEKMEGDARRRISDLEHDLTDMRLRAEHAEAACDELRALFREEKVLNPTNFYAADRLRVRIDALLNKGGGE